MITPAAPPDVLPHTCISQVSGRMDWRGSTAAEEFFAGVSLPAQLQGAVLSRQLEFLAGRWCARAALRAIDPDGPGDVAIGAGGVPVWPSGYVGSITHTRDFVWASAALCRDIAAIGIDSEQIIPAGRARRLGPRIASRSEIASTGDALSLDAAAATSLLFSAKEALFKCLYTHRQRPCDFDFLDVCIEISAEPASFRALLHPSFCDALPAGLAIEGRFQIGATHVHTGVVIGHAGGWGSCMYRK